MFTEERNGSKRINDRLGEGYALDGMGAALLRLGNASRALELYEQALTIQKEIEDEIGAMQSYAGLGDAYRTLQQLDRSTEHYELQLSAAQKIGKQQGIAKALFNLSVVMAARGWPEAALAQAREALELFEEIGSKRTDEVRKHVQELTAVN